MSRKQETPKADKSTWYFPATGEIVDASQKSTRPAPSIEMIGKPQFVDRTGRRVACQCNIDLIEVTLSAKVRVWDFDLIYSGRPLRRYMA
jgi:hypothetical protein